MVSIAAQASRGDRRSSYNYESKIQIEMLKIPEWEREKTF